MVLLHWAWGMQALDRGFISMALEGLGVSAHPCAPAESWLPLSMCRDETSPSFFSKAQGASSCGSGPLTLHRLAYELGAGVFPPTPALGVAGAGCHVLPWGTPRLTV